MKLAFAKKQNTMDLSPGNNKLVGKTISHEYPTFFTLALTFYINSLVDSVLAGAFFSSSHIAAVGIVAAFGTIATGIMILFSHGTYVGYTVALGRGQRRKTGEIFAVGLAYILSAAALIALAVMLWAEPIVGLFGASTAELKMLSARYLRYTVAYYPIFILMRLFILILGVNGHPKKTLSANIINFTCNVCLTLLFVKFLPGIGIGALGLGSVCAGAVTLVYCIVNLTHFKVLTTLKFRRSALRWARFKDVLLCGQTTSFNLILDGVAAGFINTMVTGTLGADGLAIFTVVRSFWQLSQASSEAMDYVTAPLLTICYACRDKGGTRKTFDSAVWRGLIYTAVWVVVIFAVMPLLLKVYMNGVTIENAKHIAVTGIFCTLAFAPVYFISALLTTFYDATDSYADSLAMAVVPDSILGPVLMAMLLPRLGYTGMWLALGANSLVYLLLAYIIHMIKIRRLRVPADRILHLDKGLCIEYPAIDATISYKDANISELSEKIQKFLRQEKASSRISYMTALCMDELATDIVTHSKENNENHGEQLMDVKMISTDETFNIIIRNAAERYNPLDFEFNPEDFSKVGVMMAQKYARKIDYNYIYNMNMITIQIAK